MFLRRYCGSVLSISNISDDSDLDENSSLSEYGIPSIGLEWDGDGKVRLVFCTRGMPHVNIREYGR